MNNCTDPTIWLNTLLIVTSAGGIFGNIFSILVLIQPKFRTPVIVLIIGLALSDIMLLVIVNLIGGVAALYGLESACFENYDTIYTFVESLSVTFVVAINIERYIAIVHPFKVSRLCSWKQQYLAAFIVVIISTISSTMSWIIQNILRLSSMDEEKYTFISGIVDAAVLGCFSVIIPFLVISWANICIFLDLRKSKINNRTDDPSTTKMLLAVVLLFIICYSVVLAWELGWFYCIILEKYCKDYNRFYRFGILAGTINSSCNFIVYLVLGTKFRESAILLLKDVKSFANANRCKS